MDLTTEQKALQRIVCAANRYKLNGWLVVGPRHFDNVMREQIRRSTNADFYNAAWEQGFIDQWGNFLTRGEAWRIAVCQNQIRRYVGSQFELGANNSESFLHQELYSENLY